MHKGVEVNKARTNVGTIKGLYKYVKTFYMIIAILRLNLGFTGQSIRLCLKHMGMF